MKYAEKKSMCGLCGNSVYPGEQVYWVNKRERLINRQRTISSGYGHAACAKASLRWMPVLLKDENNSSQLGIPGFDLHPKRIEEKQELRKEINANPNGEKIWKVLKQKVDVRFVQRA